MNKFIKEELSKLDNLPPYDDNTVELFIPRGSIQKQHQSTSSSNQDVALEVGKSYNIQVQNYIVDEPENFTLSSNWNGGTKPTCVDMKIDVVKVMGKMIYGNTISCDGKNSIWCGWIPQGSLKKVKPIE